MKLYGPLNSGAAVGSAGSATANATSTIPLCGRIYAIQVTYNDSPPGATTDATIATAGTQAPVNTILTLTDAATDGWFYPRHQIHDATGIGITYDGTNEVYDLVCIDDFVTVTIAQANAGDSIDVYILIG